MKSQDRPSITCPKCGLVSHHQMDIECRYCGKCGYHDVPVGTPEGIPGISPRFRQPTPLMQLQAEYAALEGIFFTWKEGMTPDAKFEVLVERLLDNMRALIPYVDRGKW